MVDGDFFVHSSRKQKLSLYSHEFQQIPMPHHLHIKNMVCDRCIAAVKAVLTDAGFPSADVQLGEATITQPPTPQQSATISADLHALGFELINDQQTQTVEQIKNAIRNVVRQGQLGATNLSDFLASSLARDYSSLSSLFSSTEGRTIEQYFIAQRIERAKELIADGNLSISEIADTLGFSSPAHLSNQFKRATGLTPSQFRSDANSRRTPIDKI